MGGKLENSEVNGGLEWGSAPGKMNEKTDRE